MIAIRAARSGEARRLSALALRSKAHWGYSGAFMEQCREELTVAEARIDGGAIYVAERDGAVVGFHAFTSESAEDAELDFLFVEPAEIGTGIGRVLMAHAIDSARAAGHRRLVVQGDPNAARFYGEAGGREIGSRPSDSIPGRMLPLFEFDLS